MDDGILQRCNETELLGLAKRQGLGQLRRGLPRELLVALVAGEAPMDPRYVAGTAYTRGKLEEFIFSNIERTRSQLPGCTGHCSSYPCSEGRHALCFSPNMDRVQ